MGRSFESLRMGAKEVSARWLKLSTQQILSTDL